MVAEAPQPEPSDRAPHRDRGIAESFGDDADRYDRTRPRYPRALAEAVLAGLSGRRVLDVGIGTGLSALPFREVGAEVLGVEVDVRMAELARSRGFEVEVARFEEWDVEDRVFDAVIAGQTWHWVDPLAGTAKAAAALGPRGRLAVLWNVGDPDPDVAAGFAEVYRCVDTGLPFTPWATRALDAYEHILTRAAEGIRATGAFAQPERLRFDWQAIVTRQAWLDQVPTAGGHNRIPADRLAELTDGLGRVVDEHGGSFTMRYVTLVVTAQRVSSPA